MLDLPHPSAPVVFDLDGGRPCLDFANTRGVGRDDLHSYATLLAFASQSDLITPESAARLQALALATPAVALAVFERARRVRDALRGIFAAIANQERAPDADLETLNADLAASLGHARVVLDAPADDYAWGWAAEAGDLAAPLWPIVRSAADLLTADGERRLVRECGASDCSWLFLDTSKNRRRQWCSMQSCGNREKARRHYRRLKAQRAPDPAADAGRSRQRASRTAAAPVDAASATVG